MPGEQDFWRDCLYRRPVWLSPGDESTPFPPADTAMLEPNGLLAIGGSLSPKRLEQAYRGGIFPWFSEGQEILWWSPDPRAVLFPAEIHISRSLRKRVRNGGFEVAFDLAFEQVIRACAETRQGQAGTWITEEMIEAYCALHNRGLAHSVEVYRDGRLVGGLYGVAMGAAFFGESMFSRMPNASKVALVWLAAQLRSWDYSLIDCQVPSAHLYGLGACTIPRRDFLRLLQAALTQPGKQQDIWRFEPELDPLGMSLSASTL